MFEKQTGGVMQAQASKSDLYDRAVGRLGEYDGPSVRPPQPVISLTDAVARLSQAVSVTGEMGGMLNQRLESIGVMRPSVPTPDSAANEKMRGNEAQLAAGLNQLALQLETNNGRLADVLNRIDS